ncbi:hypothetical protein [Naasia aerilata]|uniref:Protein kinase domain-containing protein n=1 Tax=Naasia aerilata TaxID=1162966 RepID=A0ABM8GES4_9MICO|nr:hypothetical protein [Naasia aerilata]BDZ46806.1 hypothetical protein GCM10025866_27150 [Naasia aerilata]
MERGGYRQIRVLSAGAGEEVLLCRRAADESAEPVVVRLMDEESADAALAVAGAVSSPHLAPLLDLFDARDGRFGLVYPRLSSWSLADLLARRTSLSAGEAVTILVSVARGVDALHERDLSHGALRPTGVLFDDAGTPALVRLSASRPLTPATALVDRRALAALAAVVLERVTEGGALAAELTQSPEGLAPKRMQERLFALAEPRPIDYPRSASTLTIEQLLPSRATPPETQPPASPAGWLSGSVPSGLAGRGRRLVAALRTVRRRVWVPALVAAGCLVLALLIVPGEASSAAGEPRPAPSGAPSPRAATEAPQFAAPDRSALQADDPLTAARVLAAARDSCLESGGGECAGAVDQPGSALLEADAAGRGPEPPTLPAPEGRRSFSAPATRRSSSRAPSPCCSCAPTASGASATSSTASRRDRGVRRRRGGEARDAKAAHWRSAGRFVGSADQRPSWPSNAPSSRRFFTWTRKRAASAPSTMRWS